jgi:prevent-host-death family protein
MTKTVPIGEAQLLFLKLLAAVRDGDEIIISDDNRPIARIVSIDTKRQARIAGLNRGEIKMSDDFDEPLPDNFWTGNS